MVSLLDSAARRLLVVGSLAQTTLSGILLLPRAELQDQCGGLTASEVASQHAYAIYLLLFIVVATELTVTAGMALGCLRRAFFFLVLVLYAVLAYHFGWLISLLFVKTMGRISCFGDLGKAAIVVGSVFLFARMCGTILVCFLAAFLGDYIFMEVTKNNNK